MERLIDFTKTLLGYKQLPKAFRNTLKKYGEYNITKIEVCRTPINRVAKTFANLITLGNWDDIVKRAGHDEMFHLYSILTLDNGEQLILEKNERPVLWTSIPEKTQETESRDILGLNIPLKDFIEKTIERMGIDNYIYYSALSLNCQDFIINHLRANGIDGLDSFVLQDLEGLIRETPSFSKYLSQKATDIGGRLSEIAQSLFYKKGGFIRNSRKNRRFG
jgi:hypothetical protein